MPVIPASLNNMSIAGLKSSEDWEVSSQIDFCLSILCCSRAGDAQDPIQCASPVSLESTIARFHNVPQFPSQTMHALSNAPPPHSLQSLLYSPLLQAAPQDKHSAFICIFQSFISNKEI